MADGKHRVLRDEGRRNARSLRAADDVGKRSDGLDRDADFIAGDEREVVGRHDAGAGHQQTSIRESGYRLIS